MLGAAYRVTLATGWQADDADDSALMIALHARRSAPAISAWKRAHGRPLLLALTGTDLYRDIDGNGAAQTSLALADALVVLNLLGPQRLPLAMQAKCRVLLQSCSQRKPMAKTGRHLRALMVGHLREEKDPQTYFAAARQLAGRRDILLDHIGAALDPALGAQANALAAALPHYRWLGGRPHAEVRRRIQAAHVLVHASRIEGGAHVVIEALRSGTPVLASRIDGNLGLLGSGYGGCFEAGDAMALATLLQQARDDADMLPALQAHCDARSPLFAPEAEAEGLRRLVAQLLSKP